MRELFALRKFIAATAVHSNSNVVLATAIHRRTTCL